MPCRGHCEKTYYCTATCLDCGVSYCHCTQQHCCCPCEDCPRYFPCGQCAYHVYKGKYGFGYSWSGAHMGIFRYHPDTIRNELRQECDPYYLETRDDISMNYERYHHNYLEDFERLKYFNKDPIMENVEGLRWEDIRIRDDDYYELDKHKREKWLSKVIFE